MTELEMNGSVDVQELHLLETRTKLSQSLFNLEEEMECISSRIAALKERKGEAQLERKELIIKINNLKLLLFDIDEQIRLQTNHVQKMNGNIKESENHIAQQTLLTDFENKMMDIKSVMESAMNFYTEESLQVQLMKRNGALREKRVEYTRIETEFKELHEKLEERAKAKEKARLAELEKIRQEEERLREIEEEKSRAEDAKQRHSFRDHKLETIPESEPMSPFLGKLSPSNSAAATNSSNGKQLPQQSFIDQPNSESADKKSAEMSEKGYSPPMFSSFSQFLRW